MKSDQFHVWSFPTSNATFPKGKAVTSPHKCRVEERRGAMDFIERVLYNDDSLTVREPYHVNEDAMEKYMHLIEVLNEYKAKGVLDFKADHYAKPYSLHSITINWVYDEDGYSIMETDEVKRMIELADTLLTENGSNEWQLSATLYVAD